MRIFLTTLIFTMVFGAGCGEVVKRSQGGNQDLVSATPTAQTTPAVGSPLQQASGTVQRPSTPAPTPPVPTKPAPSVTPVPPPPVSPPPPPAPAPTPTPTPVTSAPPAPIPATKPPVPAIAVSGWFAYWYTAAGQTSAAAGAGTLQQVDLFWYRVRADNMVETKGGNAGNNAVLAGLRGAGYKAFATIAETDTARMRPLFSDPSLRARHIQALLAELTSRSLDGVDVDFENLAAQDRDGLVAYVTDLADAVHRIGLKISVAVMPKTSEPGAWGSQIAYNYPALGRVVDQFKIMTYNQHYSGGAPGPIADPAWTEKVIRFAASQMDPAKVYVGVPFYGYDWPAGGKGVGVTWAEAEALAASKGATPKRDAVSGEMTFEYTLNGVRHTVWYQDAESLARKAAVAKRVGVGGVAIWKLGSEESGTWDRIRQATR